MVSSTVFEEAPWLLMLSEMRGFENHTILNIKQKALEHRLVGRKVPILTGVVQSIDRTLPDPLLVLRDRTGKYLQFTIISVIPKESFRLSLCNYYTSCTIRNRK